ncbi:uncharacterized protein LOC115381737 [Salarias fasciatus]|uniref:uncharacterized protein LOC115381737 n=1 Tax=Salarias fasciatus TaxID=181472 RepID=UPI001176ACFA|nr:ankyrin repeat and LEM domain-containing protein 1 [Salarias fasciatus]
MHRTWNRLESELCKAVTDGEPRSVQLLLSQGARPDLVSSKGVAAIHLAVGKETEKNIRCLKIMLQHGADPNIRSAEGLTPLHVAALWGCYQNLKLLLLNGGNPNIHDNDGNTPSQLAEQQENRKCAHLLQEYQKSPVDPEDEDLPQFQYSVLSDHTDTSSYPESDCNFSFHSSRISEFGEAPMSSTRRSSFFNLSAINGQPSCREASYNRHSNHSILSSTRMSAVGFAAGVSLTKRTDTRADDGILISKKNECAATTEDISCSRRDPLPAFHSTSRKSVSFRDVDEYFPVFSPESPKYHPVADGSQCPSTLPFDISEYSDFLDSERMATILPQQGLDVTSPDHVYVFSRENCESTEVDLEKTVMSCLTFEDDFDDDEQRGENMKETQVNTPKQARSPVGSSGSGTGSSQYSSCESDHYASALDAPGHHGKVSLPAGEKNSAGTESDKNTQISIESEWTRHGPTQSPLQAKPKIISRPASVEPLPGIPGKLIPSQDQHRGTDELGDCNFSFPGTSNKGVDLPAADARSDTFQAPEENFSLPFTPSPFVTGRTRSRLSRCSMASNRTQERLLTSSLFEETLPVPARTCRQTPRSQSRADIYSSPHPAPHSASGTAGDPSSEGFPETQSCSLDADSSLSNSQADTFILPKSRTDSAADTQTLCDTIVLEKKQDNSIDTYERNLAEIILAIQGKRRELPEENEFLTDDLTSADEKRTKGNIINDPNDRQDNLQPEDAYITDDCSSQSDSAPSSSSSSYFSPRRSQEDSDLPYTPGTGCTPRYSMSRLPVPQRPQHLANLSYTPGGRPLIHDVEEPVEYLYTDTEQGHRLIETHVPPTTDTSLSSSMSTTSSEETILYDWRSLQPDTKNSKGKENQKPHMVQSGVEESSKCQEPILAQTRGLTDKELRRKLVELGESPGPISSRTRPTYMRRLCCLLAESSLHSQHPKKQLDQAHTDLGYSPELCLALRTFKLPNCQSDEQSLCLQFDQPDQNRKWREGIIKSSFNYLLLDPRVTKNLPFRSHTMTPQECFQTFISAIFYVGKGKRSRPYSHLYEALEYYKGDKSAKRLCPKVQHILQVWSTGQGVISLHCFQNVIPVEAYTREACMVEAIGLKMLTNQKRGDFYGVVSNWQSKRKRELGIHLLYRAMQIFLAEGERQLRPADIRQ